MLVTTRGPSGPLRNSVRAQSSRNRVSGPSGSCWVLWGGCEWAPGVQPRPRPSSQFYSPCLGGAHHPQTGNVLSGSLGPGSSASENGGSFPVCRQIRNKLLKFSQLKKCFKFALPTEPGARRGLISLNSYMLQLNWQLSCKAALEKRGVGSSLPPCALGGPDFVSWAQRNEVSVGHSRPRAGGGLLPAWGLS